MSNLEELMKKYSDWKAKADTLETQYKEALQIAESYQRVIADLDKQPLKRTPNLFVSPVTESPSGKYKDMTMNAAISEILKTEKNLTVNEIHQKLIEGGFHSNSQTLKRDVATKLSDLKRNEYLSVNAADGISRFSLIKDIPTRSRRTT